MIKKKHNIQFTILATSSVQFTRVKYIHIAVKQISKNFSARPSETSHPLNNDFSFPTTALPGRHL